MRLRRVLVVLLLVVASACGGGGGGGDDAREEPGAAGPNPSPSPGGPLVVLVRYGGATGASERVTVDVYGQVTIEDDRSPAPTRRRLPPGDLATLRTALDRSEIATLERNYLDQRASGTYQYDVTYQGATVTADERVVPVKLRPVVDQLTKLLP